MGRQGGVGGEVRNGVGHVQGCLFMKARRFIRQLRNLFCVLPLEGECKNLDIIFGSRPKPPRRPNTRQDRVIVDNQRDPLFDLYLEAALPTSQPNYFVHQWQSQ